jgi:hypothetical protein
LELCGLDSRALQAAVAGLAQLTPLHLDGISLAITTHLGGEEAVESIQALQELLFESADQLHETQVPPLAAVAPLTELRLLGRLCELRVWCFLRAFHAWQPQPLAAMTALRRLELTMHPPGSPCAQAYFIFTCPACTADFTSHELTRGRARRGCPADADAELVAAAPLLEEADLSCGFFDLDQLDKWSADMLKLRPSMVVEMPDE